MKLSDRDLDVLYSALLDHVDKLEERFAQGRLQWPPVWSEAAADEIDYAKELLERFEDR